jgi:KDO2-lipid IV(A) lauroyltransferase
VEFKGLEHLTAALSKGKGVIFVTAHLGSWDVGGAALAATEGLPRLSAIVEPVEKESSNNAVTEMRERGGIGVIPLGQPVRVLRALKRNEIVFMLAERLVGAEGVKVDFFGAETSLPKGAAYWALKSGAPIVPGFCIRQRDGSYIGYIEAPIDPSPGEDFELDLKRHTQRLADVMARYIERYPEQWCMLQPVWREV